MTVSARLLCQRTPAEFNREPRRTISEFARELGVNRSTMQNYVGDSSSLPPVLREVSHKKYYSHAALKAWWVKRIQEAP